MKITKEHYELIKEKWRPFLQGVPTDEQFDCSYIMDTLEGFMEWGRIDKETFISILEQVIEIFTNVNTEDHYNKVLDILEEKEIVKNKFNREDSEDKHFNFILALCGDIDSVEEYFTFKDKQIQDIIKQLDTSS